MNKSFVLLSVAVAMIAIEQRSLAEDLSPALLVQPPENVFTPMGFDDNDNSQVVLFGNLPDTCHKVGPMHYRVDKEKKTIFVRNEVYFYSGCWCADVLVPYTQALNIGVLNAGNYEIAVEKPDGSFQKMAALPIAVATTLSPDDYLYAPVEYVHLEKHGADAPELVVNGVFHNSCMILKELKVTYRPNHVIEVQPIAELEGTNCTSDARLFSQKIKLTGTLKGRTLIHVRSLNGQSLNQVEEF